MATPGVATRVRDLMTPAPITARPETSLADARALMAKQRIRHLLVTGEGGELLGIVTDRDIRRSLPSPVTSLSVWELNHLLEQVNIGEIMTRGSSRSGLTAMYAKRR